VAVPRQSPYPRFPWIKELVAHERVTAFIANAATTLHDGGCLVTVGANDGRH
jgi:hypothetical protein